MTPQLCSYEPTVLEALRGGESSANVREHLKACAACRESELVWRYLEDCAAEFEARPLPSPEVIWWRAQLAQKRRLASRSVAAITAVQKAATALALLLLAFASVIWGPEVFGRVVVTIPMALAVVIMAAGSTAALFYAWRQGQSAGIFSSQR